MSDTADTPEHEGEIAIHAGDEILFGLREGRRPITYPDMVTRVSYEVGFGIIHVGTVWALGYIDGAEALELEDDTIVLIEDIDPDSVVITALGDPDEEDES